MTNGKLNAPLVTANSLEDFQNALLAWFEENGRPFPWRRTSDPYAILVAEKLLQQTRVRGAVVAAYEEILHRYPTVQDLARADITVLEEIVQPLGLVYRASELKRAAQEIFDRFGGEFPARLEHLLSITGVGQYTARAVLCFAFQQDVAVVDTNVARFLHRLYCLEESAPPNPARKRSLIDAAQSLLPPDRSGAFNLAILDLCAGVCVPGEPLCGECPVRAYCGFGQARCRE